MATLEMLTHKTFALEPTILPTIPERVETPILTMTKRRKALTVFGLMPIRLAISLLVKPCRSNSIVSR